MLIKWRSNSGFPAVSSMFDDFFNNDLTSFFGRDMSEFFNQNQNLVMPAVNIKESSDNFQIEVAAPGLRKEDFKLHLENKVLTVSAVKESRSEFAPQSQNQTSNQAENNSPSLDNAGNQITGDTGTTEADADQNTSVSATSGNQSSGMQTATQSAPHRYTRQEFSYTSFQRSFTLPEATEPEQISANYQDGILTITVPKKQQNPSNTKRSISIS